MLLAVIHAGCGRSGLSEYEKRQRGNALFRQAINAEESGDIDGAIKLYKQVMIDEPTAYSAHFMLATLLHDHAEDYIGAIYHYKRYIELEPESEKRELAEERIKIAEHLLAPKIIRRVGDTSPALQQAHMLKEAARLNGIIARLEGEKAELSETVQKNEALLKELTAENAQLRKIVEKMRGEEFVEGQDRPLKERIGEQADSGKVGSTGFTKAELESLRREASGMKVESSSETPKKPVVEVPSVKSVLEKVQNRLTGPENEANDVKAERDREAREAAESGDLSELSLFKTPKDDEKKENKDGGEKQIYVVQPGDSLMRIADRFYGDKTKWKRIRDANRSQIGPDGRVRAGQNIVIP